MKILHVVPDFGNPANGVAVAARLVAESQEAQVIDAMEFLRRRHHLDDISAVWVHSCWTPAVLRSCAKVLLARKPLVIMPHGNLDGVRLAFHAWKKRLVFPAERFFLRRASTIVATCQAEAAWIRAFEPRVQNIEVLDLKKFFNLPSSSSSCAPSPLSPSPSCAPPCMAEFSSPQLDSAALQAAPSPPVPSPGTPIRLLYLGRRHPLKGLQYLEEAIRQLRVYNIKLELRIASSAFGAEKDAAFKWCDALVLPTLSENFGIVVAEALERGRRVITTDGAPAWDPDSCGDFGGRLAYLRGFRDGSDDTRVALLLSAISSLPRVS